MLSWKEFEEYAAELNINKNYVEQNRDFFEHLEPAVFDRFFAAKGNFDEAELRKIFPGNEYMRMLFILSVASFAEMRQVYCERNYPSQMMDDIRNDLNIWLDKFTEDYGIAGINMRIFRWTRAVRTGNLLQFGRLQCNYDHKFEEKVACFCNQDGSLRFDKCENHNDNAIFSYGDPAVNIHIPASGALNMGQCLDSLRRMVEFFTVFRKDFDYRAIVCYSWILDPVFSEIMPDGNLAEFQKLGHLFRMDDADQTGEVIWRIFNIPDGTTADADRFPMKTRMQRAAAEYLKNGGTFCEYCMIILKEELSSLLCSNK